MPYPATTMAHRIHPATGERFLLAMATIQSLVTAIVPPSLAMISTTPCHERKNASVTTNDGMPTFATSHPVRAPMARPIDGGGQRDPRRIVIVEQPRHRDRAHASGSAGRQVDLTEEEDEHETDADERDRRRLRQEVGEVA